MEEGISGMGPETEARKDAWPQLVPAEKHRLTGVAEGTAHLMEAVDLSAQKPG